MQLSCVFKTFHYYRHKGRVPCLSLPRTKTERYRQKALKFTIARYIYTPRASTYSPSWRKACPVVSTVSNYTAVPLCVGDITSTLLSWEGWALVYVGINQANNSSS